MESPTKQNPLAIEFRTAAEKFRLIDNNGVAIIVPFAPLVRQNTNSKVEPIKNTELNEYFLEHLKLNNISNWQEQLNLLRVHNFANEDVVFSESFSLPEPLESWFRYLESDPLKHSWIYRKLQRYTITISEYELNKLPKNVIYERAGLLILDNGYYDIQLGALTLNPTISPDQSVL